MKYISAIASVALVVAMQFALSSCNNNSGTTTLPGAWDKAGDFEGLPRSGAASFVLDGYAYVVGGFNSDLNQKLPDMWRYDATADSWLQVDSMPGVPRSNAVAFTIGHKAYVGTGVDINFNKLSDFYEYDPAGGPLGTWKKIADFGFSADLGQASVSPRYSGIGFTVGGRGFAGAGQYLSTLKDLWEYLPGTDVWVKRPSVGGTKRANAFVMVIDDIAYVGGGSDQGANGSIVVDFYSFDVTKIDSNPWTALTSLTGKDANGNAIVQPRPRQLAVAFAINGFGYLTTGSTGTDTWQYTPPIYNADGTLKSGDSWIQYFSFVNNVPVAGSGRTAAVGFAIDKYGYVTTGYSGNLRLDDCWRFDPTGVEPDNK